VVSNEEIKRMLDAKRKGIKIEDEQSKSETYKICPQCKTKNPEKAIFCVNCGCKMDKNINIKCPSCGTENTNIAKFCVGCGEKLNQKTIIEEPKKVKPKLQPTEDLSKNESESIKKPSETTNESNIKPIIPPDVPEHDIIAKNDSKKICPSCNGKNLKTAKFCVICGKNFNKKEKTSTLEKETPEETESNKSGTAPPEIKVPEGILNINKYENKGESNKKSGLTANDTAETESANIDPVEKIKKSKELLDMGAITSEEFENIKKKYLEQI
jgi:membrane protease subunit (stomatin/prohibitin family)